MMQQNSKILLMYLDFQSVHLSLIKSYKHLIIHQIHQVVTYSNQAFSKLVLKYKA